MFDHVISHLRFVRPCLPNRHRQKFHMLATVEVLVRCVSELANGCVDVHNIAREGYEAIE